MLGWKDDNESTFTLLCTMLYNSGLLGTPVYYSLSWGGGASRAPPSNSGGVAPKIK